MSKEQSLSCSKTELFVIKHGSDLKRHLRCTPSCQSGCCELSPVVLSFKANLKRFKIDKTICSKYCVLEIT